MGLSRLERYVFGKTFLALVTASAMLIGVVWIIRAIQRVDVVMSKGQGIATYLQMTTLAVPTLAALIAPIGLLIALVQTVNHLNDESELIVMSAAGASRTVLLRSFLSVGIIVSLFVYFLMLFITPLSMQTLRTFITEMRADLVSVAVREGAFRAIGRGRTFQVAGREPGGVLKGVFILDGRTKKETLTYMAKTGVITKIGDQSFLALKDGQIHRLPASTEQVSVIKFDSYAFNLSTFSGAKVSKSSTQTEIPTYELFYPDKTDPYYQRKPGVFRAELHARLTGGLYPIATVMIVIGFVGFPRSNRQGHVTATTIAATTAVSLRALGVAAEGALTQNASMVPVVWAIPLSGILVPAVVMASGRSLAPPQWLVMQLEALRERVAATSSAVIQSLPFAGQSSGRAA